MGKRRFVVLAAVLALSGCGGQSHEDDPDAAADGDADADADGDGDADCHVPEPEPGQCYATDGCCPTQPPAIGGFCEEGLSCSYEAWEADIEESFWYYDCQQGHWTASTDCFNGCDERATFVETCSEPFAGELPGATIEIGPATPGEPFRAFDDGELVGLITPHHCTRIPYRIRVSGVEVPACLDVSASVHAENFAPRWVEFPVTMHCDESLDILSIVSLSDVEIVCDPGGPNVLGLLIEVQIAGVGEASASVRAEMECPEPDPIYGLHCSPDGV